MTKTRLVDLLEFGRVNFDAALSLTPKNTIKLLTKWPIFKLDDLMFIARGASPRPIKDFITTDIDGINWIKIGDVAIAEKYITKTEEKITIEGSLQSRSVKSGDFILSNSMSFGRPYILKINGCVHDGWLLLTNFDSRLDKNYLYEILGYEKIQQQFRQQAGGGVVQNLNSERVRSVKIPLPPIETQQKIVAECEAVDQLVEQAKIDFSKAKDSIENLLNTYSGQSSDKLLNVARRISDNIDPQQQTGEVNYIGLENIEAQTGRLVGSIRTSYTSIKSAKTKFQAGDVLYGKLRPNLNKVYLAKEDGICSTDIYVLRLANEKIAKIYTHVLRSASFNSKVLMTVSGQQLPRTAWSSMGILQIPVFSLAEQASLLSCIDYSENMTATAQTIIDAASSQKQSILQKYL
jgi:restriction endonuclease S subunit